jgi:TrmH family RNA methyltransferase
MIRTAAAFGLDVMTAGRTVDAWSPKVLRAGAGAHFQTGVSALDLTGFKTVATTISGGRPPWDLPHRQLAILVGSEAQGLPNEVVANADYEVSIPMPGGSESLNASIAAAIVCYEVAKPTRR